MAETGVPSAKSIASVGAAVGAGDGGAQSRRTHWAHVAVVTLHAICCGLPILASVAGIAASAALMGGVLRFHSFLHGRELWLLGISAALVMAGWIAERRFMRRTGAGVSPLFWVSLACFAFNAAIVVGHRLGA
jgi:hypothetical protein